MRCTNEENQAIKDLKRLEEVIKNNIPNNKNIKAIQIVLNLLEKQQKEIGRLLMDNHRLDRENQLKFEKAVDTSDYVNKEIIRNKIAELQERLKYYEELDLPEIDENGVRTGIIKEEEILTSRARILVLKELLGDE